MKNNIKSLLKVRASLVATTVFLGLKCPSTVTEMIDRINAYCVQTFDQSRLIELTKEDIQRRKSCQGMIDSGMIDSHDPLNAIGKQLRFADRLLDELRPISIAA
jgi:hypothetical protein